MASYVTLFNWTEQGVKNVKDTVNRAREVVAGIEKSGGKITLFWTQGRYDIVAFGELADDETATALALNTTKSGFTRTETMRAFTMQEMERILKRVS